MGYGAGQLKSKILPNLPTTPGVQQVLDTREDVSSHNTWLDITGDLGFIGLILFVSVFVVTMIGFIRPRWAQTKELSTTLAVMMLPVFTSSMFLPLFNNKLAWSLIGLSAALQVPSWGTRWRGYLERRAPAALPAGMPDRTPVVPTGRTTGPGPAPVLAEGHEVWAEPTLARWDLRVSRRFRLSILAGAVIGFVVFGSVIAGVPARYTATGGIVVPRLDATKGNYRIFVDRTQIQGLHTLATSGAYAAELKELSGIDLSIPEIRDRVTASRPEFAAFMEIHYTDTDEENTLKALPYIVTALDNVVADARAFAEAGVADELRPMYPGEQRTYTGELYLPAYQDPVVDVEVPRRTWASLVGALTGMLVATGFTLLQQRRPRVNNDDDLYGALGARVWTHVGRAGRRFAATRDQYAQVVTVAQEMSAADSDPRHVVISTPRPGPCRAGPGHGRGRRTGRGGTPGGPGGRPVGPPPAHRSAWAGSSVPACWRRRTGRCRWSRWCAGSIGGASPRRSGASCAATGSCCGSSPSAGRSDGRSWRSGPTCSTASVPT